MHMARLARIALLLLLLAGLSFQGAWASAIQCSGEQDLQQVVRAESSSMDEAALSHAHEGPTASQDCGTPANSSCAPVGLLPCLPASSSQTGSAGVLVATGAPAALFVTDGPDRPPRASLA